jgi:hypothetical protein
VLLGLDLGMGMAKVVGRHEDPWKNFDIPQNWGCWDHEALRRVGVWKRIGSCEGLVWGWDLAGYW